MSKNILKFNKAYSFQQIALKPLNIHNLNLNLTPYTKIKSRCFETENTAHKRRKNDVLCQN